MFVFYMFDGGCGDRKIWFNVNGKDVFVIYICVLVGVNRIEYFVVNDVGKVNEMVNYFKLDFILLF